MRPVPPGKTYINQPLATLATSLSRHITAQIRHSQSGHGTSSAHCLFQRSFAVSRQAIVCEPLLGSLLRICFWQSMKQRWLSLLDVHLSLRSWLQRFRLNVRTVALRPD
jgi:hypothetical protein